MEYDRREEVPALLGVSEISDNEEPEIMPYQDTDSDAAASTEDINTESLADQGGFATEIIHDLPNIRQIDTIPVESGNTAGGLPHVGIEIKNILELLQDSLANTQYISSKMDAVSSETNSLIKQVNSISVNGELLAAEMESITSDANTKGMLSKTFLSISSVIVGLLAISEIYMFTSQIKMQQLQNSTASAVLKNISGLNKKMAVYDKNLTKALEHSTQQEHAQPNPAVGEKTGHETHGNKEVGSATVTPVLEKLNKLRNGLPEKKLIRKETGDWFVYNKKSEECISDVEVIEALNQAYKKIGRTILPAIPMPTHNALCILKPDGKGGTDIVMTKVFLP
jgi:hypothetical protein